MLAWAVQVTAGTTSISERFHEQAEFRREAWGSNRLVRPTALIRTSGGMAD
jgi:hypothetical protein